MVFVCFPQVQKSLNTDGFLTIFDKSEQNPPKFIEELFGVDWSESGGRAGGASVPFTAQAQRKRTSQTQNSSRMHTFALTGANFCRQARGF